MGIYVLIGGLGLLTGFLSGLLGIGVELLWRLCSFTYRLFLGLNHCR